jgi:hypothetical protein
MESLQDKIAKRAYELFLARGGQHGYHIEDWSRAEKEIMTDKESLQKAAKTAAPKATSPKVTPSVDVPVSKPKASVDAPAKAEIPQKSEAPAKTVAPAKKKVAKKKAVS